MFTYEQGNQAKKEQELPTGRIFPYDDTETPSVSLDVHSIIQAK